MNKKKDFVIHTKFVDQLAVSCFKSSEYCLLSLKIACELLLKNHGKIYASIYVNIQLFPYSSMSN